MILITGASRGIGRFLLQNLRSEGEEVRGTFLRTPPPAEDAEYYSRVDITHATEVQAWVDRVAANAGNLVLVHCAGVNYNAVAHKADPAQWLQVVQTNLAGAFHAVRAVLPHMRRQGFGRIICMSSVVAQTGIPGTSAYAASKAGLWGLARSVAAENAGKGITINNLNLGYFDIGMIAEVPPEYQDVIRQRIPTHRFGDPENILRALRFLIAADYVNGTSIDMNAALH